MLESILDQRYFGNSLSAYAVSAAVAVGGVLFVWVANGIIFRRLKKWAEKTETDWDDFLLNALQKTAVPLLYFGAFRLGMNGLEANPAVHKAFSAAGAALVTILGIRFIVQCARFLILGYWLKRQNDQALSSRITGLVPILTVAIWGIGIIFFLDNLGFKVSAVLAGLGIGGVAVALASQAVLGDLFSYFCILLDRPFEIGDFIVSGDFMGSVEHVGIKTTRVRSLDGEQLVFSNTDLTSSRIRNYKRMESRRVVFRLGLNYDTTPQALKETIAALRRIVESVKHTRFDRAHFFSYGDFSLVVEVVYFVLSGDYNLYMDIQQEINFAIKEDFEERKVGFAFPTQTILLQKTS